MRKYLFLSLLALSLAGCGGGGRQIDNAGAADAEAGHDGRAAAQDLANRAVAETRQETLEKRVVALEHDVDRLKAEVETQQGLDAAQRAQGGSAIGPSSPLVTPSPPLPSITPPPVSAPMAKNAQK